MGQIIFGICCGILTGLFRCFGANAEGVSFAIILSNILVPLIEKHTVPMAFGQVKGSEEAGRRQIEMNKKIVHDALVLFAFTVVLGLILGVVYGITKGPIDQVNYEDTVRLQAGI